MTYSKNTSIILHQDIEKYINNKGNPIHPDEVLRIIMKHEYVEHAYFIPELGFCCNVTFYEWTYNDNDIQEALNFIEKELEWRIK